MCIQFELKGQQGNGPNSSALRAFGTQINLRSRNFLRLCLFPERRW
jgi:hypothetical protein